MIHGHFAVLSLGSNLGDREDNLRQAVRLLTETGSVSDLRVSHLYETEPVGYDDQGYFLNICISFRTCLTPRQLLELCGRIEQDLHRVRLIKNGPRTIDLDIIFYDDITVEEDDLQIPHPRMKERAFVLMPLADILDIDLPVPSDKSVTDLGQFDVSAL